MTIELFMFLFTIGSVASSLLTQAMKKAFKNLSSNMLALASAFHSIQAVTDILKELKCTSREPYSYSIDASLKRLPR